MKAPTALAVLGGVTIVAVWALTMLGEDEGGDRRKAVASRGAQVMPFDLDATSHRFAKGRDGGTESVVADDPRDRRQVRLIREHLRKEAAAFRRGDFRDPAAIHGEKMPGLAVLRSHPEGLDIRYRRRPQGGEIRFKAEEAPLRKALHDWFDAQVADHGDHAEHTEHPGD